MKFLCVKCDEPMKLAVTSPPDRGSLRLLYACPSCSHEIAMLTNPHETQVVQSMGVAIGPGEHAAEGRCPFPGMVQEMASEPSTGMTWTPEAQARLANIPEFVRPMARTGIEKFARDEGRAQVDEGVLDRAKDFFGM